MNNALELYDTTIFNDTLEALDTGKAIYLFDEDGYAFITGFTLTIADNFHFISLFILNGNILTIYPSEGYNISDLYTPTNIVFSEIDVPIA